MTQVQAVIETIEKLGGIATLTQINQKIFEVKDCNWGTKTPFASIRRIVRHTKGKLNDFYNNTAISFMNTRFLRVVMAYAII